MEAGYSSYGSAALLPDDQPDAPTTEEMDEVLLSFLRERYTKAVDLFGEEDSILPFQYFLKHGKVPPEGTNDRAAFETAMWDVVVSLREKMSGAIEELIAERDANNDD